MKSLHLDYLSCLLSILSTVLVGQKRWSSLLISIVNSLIVCAIGFHTLQFGFIPANLFCIGVNAFSIRSWLKDRATSPESSTSQEPLARSESARGKPVIVRLLTTPRVLGVRKQALAN